MTTPELINSITAAGGTGHHIARILNVSDALVSRWRNGHREPNDLQLAELRRLHQLTRAGVPLQLAVAS